MKNLFNYIRNIPTLIPHASLPVQFHNWSEMLCFKFVQQLFNSTVKVLILQNTNYIMASEGGGKKTLCLCMFIRLANNCGHLATQHLLLYSTFGIKVALCNSSIALIIKDIKIIVVKSTCITLLIGPHNFKNSP